MEGPSFLTIHPDDLEILFAEYDQGFFEGAVNRLLDGRRLSFRLSKRMTRSAGTTTRWTRKNGKESYEIAVSSFVLFDGFQTTDSEITVAGIQCRNRLEALLRVFEHELVHLLEFLAFGNTNCKAARFQELARCLFLHECYTHALVTRGMRAARLGVGVGSPVSFNYKGRTLEGLVVRITKRATVLVPDSRGAPYSDSRRYRKYYVPLPKLTRLVGRNG